MNILLWRVEFGGRTHGTSVPVEMVWEKVLNAPDVSQLGIAHHGRQVGHAQWAANIGPDLSAKKVTGDDGQPEGMVEGPSVYKIDFRGSIALNDVPGRLNFDFDIKASTNQDWQQFNLLLRLHSSTWEIHSSAAERIVRLNLQDEGEKSEYVFKFDDLQDTQKLARVLDLPVPLEIFGAMGWSPKAQSPAALASGLKWVGREDLFTIGHTPVRAYRLEAKLFDRYGIAVIVSQVGQIMRVELPDNWVLINDNLTTL